MAGLWFDPGFDRSRPSGPESALLPLGERLVGAFDPSRVDPSPGRRLRVVAALVHCVEPSTGAVALRDTHHPFLVPGGPITYGKLLDRLQSDADLEDVRVTLARLPLRLGQPRPLVETVPGDYQWTARDPDLPPALQDLGDEINEDIREALETLDDGSAYYAGVDEGIEPVADEHVKLVIWALQRELNRELRPAEGQYGGSAPLPAAPLEDLSWNVQRALAERRRLRYAQWGIGRSQWERGEWSVWDVPLDEEYVPRRSARLAPASRAA